MPYDNRRQTEDNSVILNSTIKGILALFATILVVVVIVMLFAKSLFFPSADAKPVKTGHLTQTEEISVAETEPAEEVEAVTTKKKKKKTTAEEESSLPEALPEGLDTSVAGDYTVNSAVYLHPEPNSSSANLATLPAGDSVKVYGNSNYGWYYLEWNGQMGYAWSSYLTKK